ncbi:hypothetical protein OE88DRAFT_1622368 [Heliocybe sulcata]|uniref:HSF-type DNA-binding domain-containing protein n=1 Tax=Heliocybe sulcata TaxID=5364 RepID=A0A5C3NHZ4_9AGAM|nr:hypothetical protein OE88DRAFT_1622368 [Heliocybe sulcata]
MVTYPPSLLSNSSSHSNSSSDQNFDAPQSPTKSPDHHQQSQQSASQLPPPPTKSEPTTGKPQATFLTKLYALLERPENHHMIRWDPTGEHIIVEKPEQLALHVLPSVYRQSRFASFSRQLNIYGFMRKVNLRNVDPAIDDPDASTWSHPTLNRHSPPEVVANFKRRVPPRLPKPKKRDSDPALMNQPPRSAIGLGPSNQVPFNVPSSQSYPMAAGKPLSSSSSIGRQRGFSAPGSFTPLSQGGAAAAGWGTSYPHPSHNQHHGGGHHAIRSALPPLTVPSDPPGMYTHSPGGYSQMSPSEENGHGGQGFGSLPSMSPYGNAGSQYPYTDNQGSWTASSAGQSGSHSGSLSSLLNPSSSSSYSPGGYHSSSSGHHAQRPTINTNYTGSSYSSLPTATSSSIPSPDSRPNTGYSVSSMSSMPPYDEGYNSRPGSSAHRPVSPGGSRPNSSAAGKNYHNGGSLSVRSSRSRRHSQAISPYPYPHDRPSTSPQPHEEGGHGIQRVRSMIQLPSVDTYGFNPAQGDFAYSAGGDGPIDNGGHAPHSSHGHSSHGAGWHGYERSVRPSTSASSLSTTSHASSAAATPPGSGVGDGFAETDVNRFSPDFGFIQMNEHLPHYAKTGEI